MFNTGSNPTDRRRRDQRWPDLLFAGEAKRSTLSQAVARGSLLRLAQGIYSGATREEPAAVVNRCWRRILAQKFPGAVIADRCARAASPRDGRLTIVHERRRPLELPGLTIEPRRGLGALDGDIVFPDGVVQCSQARGLLDNLASHGERYLSTEEVEVWISDILSHQGESWLSEVRDRARVLAGETRQTGALDRLNRKISAAFATGPLSDVVSPALRARALGVPFDRARVGAFEAFVEILHRTAPEPIPALPADADRRQLLPFYEAYFSNYIEGTEFTLDEAEAILLGGRIPDTRPEDAHDILGTYRIVSDSRAMRQMPRDADQFIEVLKARHGIVMAGRQSLQPGRFKDRANRAGATTFVDPHLVEGTLRAGFDAASSLIDPFARAAYMMFLVSEVHPFLDGNGRLARITMNGELVAADQVRIIVPTVYRDNYLAALKGATHNSRFEALLAVLRFAQRFTARVDFSSRFSAEHDLTRTNALREASEAEAYGTRLTLP